MTLLHLNEERVSWVMETDEPNENLIGLTWLDLIRYHDLSARRKHRKCLWLNEYSTRLRNTKLIAPILANMFHHFLLMIVFNANVRSPQFKNVLFRYLFDRPRHEIPDLHSNLYDRSFSIYCFMHWTNTKINKSTNQRINKSTNQQINKSTNQQINKSTNQQTNR
jgi:hypothetical protein